MSGKTLTDRKLRRKKQLFISNMQKGSFCVCSKIFTTLKQKAASWL